MLQYDHHLSINMYLYELSKKYPGTHIHTHIYRSRRCLVRRLACVPAGRGVSVAWESRLWTVYYECTWGVKHDTSSHMPHLCAGTPWQLQRHEFVENLIAAKELFKKVSQGGFDYPYE